MRSAGATAAGVVRRDDGGGAAAMALRQHATVLVQRVASRQ